MSVEVVIEGRQRADAGHHHRHRMRVAAEPVEEPRHLLVHHRVAGDAVVEIGLLRSGRQFAVEQQVAGFEEIAVLGELIDRIAAIEQHACVAVDVGDLRFGARRRGEAGIEGEHSRLGVELADIDDRRADRAVLIGSSMAFRRRQSRGGRPQLLGGLSPTARVAEVGVIERLPCGQARLRCNIRIAAHATRTSQTKGAADGGSAIADFRS